MSGRTDWRLVVEARVGETCIRRADDPQSDGSVLRLEDLGLTPRLVAACEDWAAFFDEVEGDLGDATVAEEFVGQGFKIAHKLRGELKGSRVWITHPQTGERSEIVRSVPR